MDLDDLLPAGGPNYNGSKNVWQNIWGAVKFFGSVIILVFIINTFGFQSYEVFGQSMEPTLSPGDRLLISKVEKSFARLTRNEFVPERGEIIVFHDPRQSGLQLIKRVIALPGERVVVREGKITVYNQDNPDGIHPDDAYGDDFAYTSGNVDIRVPEGHIFVAGDNRTPGGSLDSRNDLGPVPTDEVVGELVLRIFPVSDIRWF